MPILDFYNEEIKLYSIKKSFIFRMETFSLNTINEVGDIGVFVRHLTLKIVRSTKIICCAHRGVSPKIRNRRATVLNS